MNCRNQWNSAFTFTQSIDNTIEQLATEPCRRTPISICFIMNYKCTRHVDGHMRDGCSIIKFFSRLKRRSGGHAGPLVTRIQTWRTEGPFHSKTPARKQHTGREYTSTVDECVATEYRSCHVTRWLSSVRQNKIRKSSVPTVNLQSQSTTHPANRSTNNTDDTNSRGNLLVWFISHNKTLSAVKTIP